MPLRLSSYEKRAIHMYPRSICQLKTKHRELSRRWGELSCEVNKLNKILGFQSWAAMLPRVCEQVSSLLTATPYSAQTILYITQCFEIMDFAAREGYLPKHLVQTKQELEKKWQKSIEQTQIDAVESGPNSLHAHAALESSSKRSSVSSSVTESTRTASSVFSSPSLSTGTVDSEVEEDKPSSPEPETADSPSEGIFSADVQTATRMEILPVQVGSSPTESVHSPNALGLTCADETQNKQEIGSMDASTSSMQDGQQPKPAKYRPKLVSVFIQKSNSASSAEGKQHSDLEAFAKQHGGRHSKSLPLASKQAALSLSSPTHGFSRHLALRSFDSPWHLSLDFDDHDSFSPILSSMPLMRTESTGTQKSSDPTSADLQNFVFPIPRQVPASNSKSLGVSRQMPTIIDGELQNFPPPSPVAATAHEFYRDVRTARPVNVSDLDRTPLPMQPTVTARLWQNPAHLMPSHRPPPPSLSYTAAGAPSEQTLPVGAILHHVPNQPAPPRAHITNRLQNGASDGTSAGASIRYVKSQTGPFPELPVERRRPSPKQAATTNRGNASNGARPVAQPRAPPAGMALNLPVRKSSLARPAMRTPPTQV